MRKYKRILLIALGVIVFAIAGAEAYLRIFYREVLKTQIFPLMYQPDDYCNYSYIPGVTASQISPSTDTKMRVNSHGFIGKEFSAEKKSNTFRILVASYSFMSGGAIVGLVRDKFDKAGFHNIEVINCSIDGGYLNWHHCLMIKHKLLKYNPDLILYETNIPFRRKDYTRECYHGYILEYTTYSLAERDFCRRRVDTIESNLFLKGLYNSSYIVRAICKKMVHKYELDQGTFTQKYIAPYRSKRVLSGVFPDHRYTVENTMVELKKLSGEVDSAGGKLVLFDFFTYPDNFKKNICRSYGINLFNLDISTSFYNDSLKLSYDIHPNQRGYEEIANRMFINLCKYGYIPAQFCPGAN
jgi:hypothetical protein